MPVRLQNKGDMKREYIYRATIVIASLLITFIIGEFVYRAIVQDDNVYSVATTSNQYDFYQYDPRLGWANAPGATGVYSREEFTYKISINDLGMRQKPVTKEKMDGKFRIVALGDSYLWGIGVSDEERISEVLQKELPGVEVLNLGVSGYAPIQYSQMTDRVLELNPDLVILLFCLGNDFEDNVYFQRYGYAKPYAELDGAGGIIIKGMPPPDIKKLGFISSYSNRLWGSRILGDSMRVLKAHGILKTKTFKQQGLIGFKTEFIYTDDQKLYEEQRRLKYDAISINEALLGGIAREFAEADVPMVIVPAPSKREYLRNAAYGRIYGQNYGHEGYFLQAQTVLLETCGRLRLPCPKTVSILTGHDFWVMDGHWKPEGHRKMGVAVAAFLKERHLIPDQIRYEM